LTGWWDWGITQHYRSVNGVYRVLWSSLHVRWRNVGPDTTTNTNHSETSHECR